ncbi:hypothetical protein BD626DRAFT_566192 [Schizophyllum amplum]|uniref:Uncharacterized protein n=1 Tax=Schizophyllum amplum TaxID=97359 RepID=A0A550CQT7_9AGAR|nr:hypothetical protein BD626DRAFT_566192 [Auriculariopsis ampla]
MSYYYSARTLDHPVSDLRSTLQDHERSPTSSRTSSPSPFELRSTGHSESFLFMPLFPENDFTISSASSCSSPADRYRPLFPDTRNTQGPHEPLSEPVSPMLDPNGRGDPVGPARHSASVARDASTSRSPSNTQHTHVTQGASALDGCRMWSEDVFSHGPNAIFPSTTCKEHEHVPRSDVPEGPCCPPPRRVSRASSALKRSLAEIDTSTNASGSCVTLEDFAPYTKRTRTSRATGHESVPDAGADDIDASPSTVDNAVLPDEYESEAPADDEGPPKPKRNIMQRVEDIRADVFLFDFGPHWYICGGCLQIYQGDKRNDHYPGLWEKHARSCSIIQDWCDIKSKKRPSQAHLDNMRRNREKAYERAKAYFPKNGEKVAPCQCAALGNAILPAGWTPPVAAKSRKSKAGGLGAASRKTAKKTTKTAKKAASKTATPSLISPSEVGTMTDISEVPQTPSDMPSPAASLSGKPGAQWRVIRAGPLAK